jgi:hypothetical protein
LAFEAFKADIGANSYYFPLIATARVRLAQPNYIANFYVQGHFEAFKNPSSRSEQV